MSPNDANAPDHAQLLMLGRSEGGGVEWSEWMVGESGKTSSRESGS